MGHLWIIGSAARHTFIFQGSTIDKYKSYSGKRGNDHVTKLLSTLVSRSIDHFTSPLQLEPVMIGKTIRSPFGRIPRSRAISFFANRVNDKRGVEMGCRIQTPECRQKHFFSKR
jgi:hypothetical protein